MFPCVTEKYFPCVSEFFPVSKQNSLCFPCLEKVRTKFPVFPVPWPPCNIFTPVCYSVHMRGGGGMHGCSRGGICSCSGGGERVWAWAVGGMHGCSRGGQAGGQHAWLLWGACVVLFGGGMVLFGGHAWFYSGGMHGFIWRGCMRGFIRGCAWFYWGACMVLFGGACMVLFGGHAWFFQFFRIQ